MQLLQSSVNENIFGTLAKVACIAMLNAGQFCFNTGHCPSVLQFLPVFLTLAKVPYIAVSNSGHLSLNAMPVQFDEQWQS